MSESENTRDVERRVVGWLCSPRSFGVESRFDGEYVVLPGGGSVRITVDNAATYGIEPIFEGEACRCCGRDVIP